MFVNKRRKLELSGKLESKTINTRLELENRQVGWSGSESSQSNGPELIARIRFITVTK